MTRGGSANSSVEERNALVCRVRRGRLDKSQENLV